jgi:hypothetical protein
MSHNQFKQQKFIKFRDTIAYNLLKIVFTIYFFFAVSITGYHMYLDYQTAEKHIVEQLSLIEKAFQDSLSTALFDLDSVQLQSIIEGLYGMQTLVGVNLAGSNPNIFIPTASIGIIRAPQDGGTVFVSKSGKQTTSEIPQSKLIVHEFILYQPNTKTEIARGELYSSSDVVFLTVQSSFVRLVVSAAIKTGLLWLLFLWAAAGRLSHPLRLFAEDVGKLA